MAGFEPLKEQCYRANMLLPELDLVIYTFGNVSAVDRSREVLFLMRS